MSQDKDKWTNTNINATASETTMTMDFWEVLTIMHFRCFSTMLKLMVWGMLFCASNDNFYTDYQTICLFLLLTLNTILHFRFVAKKKKKFFRKQKFKISIFERKSIHSILYSCHRYYSCKSSLCILKSSNDCSSENFNPI